MDCATKQNLTRMIYRAPFREQLMNRTYVQIESEGEGLDEICSLLKCSSVIGVLGGLH